MQTYHTSSYFMESFRPIFVIARCMGLLPFYHKLDKTKHVYTIRFSTLYAALSCAFVVILATLMLQGLVKAMQNDLASTTLLDQFILVVDCVAVIMCLSTSMIFVIIHRNTLRQFMNHLTQIDDMLQLEDVRQPKYYIMKLIFIISACTVAMFFHLIMLKCVIANSSHKQPTYLLLLPYCISYYVLIVASILYWSFLDCLSRRQRALYIQLIPHLQAVQEIPYLRLMVVQQERRSFSEAKLRNEVLNERQMVRMMGLYEHLIEALDLFNKLFGPPVLLSLVSILINLIIQPYYVYQHMVDKSDLHILTTDVVRVLFHIIRLILIIEPAHRLSVELEGSCTVTRKLLSYKFDEKTEKHADLFAKKMLLLCRTSFCPCGVFCISRGVYIAVLGTVITHLVIIINLYK